MRVQFTVPGEPKSKGRPRFTKQGIAYTPKDTVMYENLVKITYKEEVGDVKLHGAIQAIITGVFPIPKSTSKKKRDLMLSKRIFHTKKIDCDNLAKTILDSLNEIAYDDDKQVSILYVCKRYGEEPKVIVELAELYTNGEEPR